MQQLPTAVTRALASIEAAKQQDPCPATQQMLDGVAELIVATGDPDRVFDSVIGALAREELREVATAYGLRLVSGRDGSALSALVTEVTLMWRERLVLLPRGQDPAVSLAQLCDALEAQADEIRLSRDFEESVAAGHVEDIETWHARVNGAQAAR